MFTMTMDDEAGVPFESLRYDPIADTRHHRYLSVIEDVHACSTLYIIIQYFRGVDKIISELSTT